MNDADDYVNEVIEYTSRFEDSLDSMAAAALHQASTLATWALVRDLYSSKEIVSAAQAARTLGMTAKEGAASLAMVTALSEAEGRGRTFFGRLKMRIPPRKGTKEYHLLKMAESAEAIVLTIDKSTRTEFAERYVDIFARDTDSP